jgi:hypothetical protein
MRFFIEFRALGSNGHFQSCDRRTVSEPAAPCCAKMLGSTPRMMGAYENGRGLEKNYNGQTVRYEHPTITR